MSFFTYDRPTRTLREHRETLDQWLVVARFDDHASAVQVLYALLYIDDICVSGPHSAHVRCLDEAKRVIGT